MRTAALIFQYGCFAFALFLCYQVGTSIYLQDYQLMDIVSDIGTILICIDLGVFLHFNKSLASLKMKKRFSAACCSGFNDRKNHA